MQMVCLVFVLLAGISVTARAKSLIRTADSIIASAVAEELWVLKSAVNATDVLYRWGVRRVSQLKLPDVYLADSHVRSDAVSDNLAGFPEGFDQRLSNDVALSLREARPQLRGGGIEVGAVTPFLLQTSQAGDGGGLRELGFATRQVIMRGLPVRLSGLRETGYPLHFAALSGLVLGLVVVMLRLVVDLRAAITSRRPWPKTASLFGRGHLRRQQARHSPVVPSKILGNAVLL